LCENKSKKKGSIACVGEIAALVLLKLFINCYKNATPSKLLELFFSTKISNIIIHDASQDGKQPFVVILA